METILAVWLMAAVAGAPAAGPRDVVQAAITRVVTVLSDAATPQDAADRASSFLRPIRAALDA